MDKFEQASRLGLRFETSKGLISTEDLWNLPLQSRAGNVSLDGIAKALNKVLKDDDVSFVAPKTTTNSVNQLRFDIVKHVIDSRLQEQDEAQKAQESKEKRQKIMEIIAEKEDNSLKSLSVDELKAMLG